MAESDSGIPQRRFGKHPLMVSALGLGGLHLGDAPDERSAIDMVQQALDGGVTYFDNCWEYHGGRSELWMGRALRGRRKNVFLTTMVCTHGRSAALATQMLEESLRRLGTDYLDLWALHGVAFDNDPALFIRKGGAAEAMDAARSAGKVRFVGFAGHKDPSIHLAMLNTDFPFDAVHLPLNPFDAGFRSFEMNVLPVLNRRGIAAIGMKAMGGDAAAIRSGLLSADEALRYAMSLPVATTVAGMERSDVLQQNLSVAQGFTPLTPAEMQSLRDRCRPEARDGRHELYKVSLKFDEPQARSAHDFPIDREEPEIRELLDLPRSTTTPPGRGT